MKRLQAGFTLIELLVVVAIIGILASIVLASVGSSRGRGRDAKIEETFHQVANQMELYNALNGNGYGTTFAWAPCPTSADASIFWSDTQTRTMIASVNTVNAGFTTCAAGNPNGGNATSWAIASPISTSAGNSNWWCTDSSGSSKISSAHIDPFIRFISYFVPVAYAALTAGPNLGGGNVAAAICP